MPLANAGPDAEDGAETAGLGADDLTAPEYVVLGMVWLGARSGYEIKQTVERSIRFFWTISQAQIYPSLQHLEQAGLLLGRADPRGKRPRRVYDVTPAGQAAIREWLRREEPLPLELRDAGLLKLFFGDALDDRDAAALLTAIKQRSRQQIAILRASQPAAEVLRTEAGPHPLLTLRIGIALHEATIKVCEEFEQAPGL